MKVYAFLFSDCVHESPPRTVGIHTTKAGAYRAMRRHIQEKYNSWYDNRRRGQRLPFSAAWYGIAILEYSLDSNDL